VAELLKLAKTLGLNVVGISFHIGSSCEDYDAYCQAIGVSRKLFTVASQMGFAFDLVDIGGGFPGDNFNRIDEFAGKINVALDEKFPVEEFPSLRVFSEPGRYFVESAFTLVSTVHSKKITKDADGNVQEAMYYLNEGVYSNFLFIPLGPETVDPKIMLEKRSDVKLKTTLWGKCEQNKQKIQLFVKIHQGPTCDSTDVIAQDIDLELLEIGDVVYFCSMGAYTIPLRTPFNGLEITKILHFMELNDW
jgi:ornithine decarboxylase